MPLLDVYNAITPYTRVIGIAIIALVIFAALLLLLRIARARLTKYARTKRQHSNITIFFKVLNYILVIILVAVILMAVGGDWAGLGVSLGLVSAALGWALQRPITGIAGWMMVIVKKPFVIGDRIIVGGVSGDVLDISLTHIHLSEIGGIVWGQENSGRVVLVPNSILFEQNIINYTHEADYVLSDLVITITFDSNLKKAITVCEQTATKATGDIILVTQRQPYVYTYFTNNGMDLHVRFFVPAKSYQAYASKVNTALFEEIKKHNDIHFAYQHRTIVFSNPVKVLDKDSLTDISG